MNCCVWPLAIEAAVGATAIDCSVAAVTVSTAVFEVTPLSEAVMLLVPVPTPEARPEALIVATLAVPEVQLTDEVRFCVEPSLYVPVAVNCCVWPLAIEAEAGAIAIDFNVAAVTVCVVWPVLPRKFASPLKVATIV